MKISNPLLRFIVLIVICLSAVPISAQTCPDNLVLYWKMDETSGTLLTETKAGINATRNTVTGPVAGKIDNSQRFTFTVNESETAYLSYEYASIPDNSVFDFNYTSSFTISYWFRFSYDDYSTGFQDHIMISKGDWYGGGAGTGGMFGTGCNGSGKINFLLRDDQGHGVDEDTETSGGYGDGEWHHAALVRDFATKKNMIYIDGDLVAERVVTSYTSSFANAFDFYFGALRNGTPQYFYKGNLDEVAIFNTALSESQIEDIITAADAGTGICSIETEAPVIISSAVTSAVVGEAYTYDVNASGSPATITYSLTTAPSGMAINSSTGVITWTPSSVGSFDVAVKASNGVDPDGTQSFTIVVSGTNPTINSMPVTNASLGELYEYTVHATGTQTGMAYSLVQNPAGMTINGTSGLISWTPGSVGVFAVKVRANNNIAPADTQSFSITVAGSSPVITSSPVTSAFVNVAYHYGVQASGTSLGMTFSLPVKPAGMTINATSGLITWTPSALGDVNVKVAADNGIAPADTQEFTISVIEPTNCPDGIISLHRLDEAAGPDYADFYDEHNATASVAPTQVPGIIDNAQQFTATTKIDIPDNGTEFDWLNRSSFSFEGWIKTSNTAAMVMVARYRTDYGGNIARWYVGTDATGHATFELRDNSNSGINRIVSGTSIVTDGEWHHIVAVRDGDANLSEIYVDGVKEASVSYTFTNSFKADDPLAVTIGYMKGAANEMHFIGAIDEVAIFNRALAESEVTTFYNGGIPSGHCRGSNNFPYFTTTPAKTVNEDASYTYNAVVTDPDVADILTISAVTKPSWLNFSYTAGTKNCSLTGTPNNSNVGDNDVVLRVTDGTMSREQIFRIVVANVNDAPVKTSTPGTSVNEGSNYSYVLTVNDIDAGDVITMTKVTLPSWLTFTWTAGTRTATITGTPDDANVGSNTIDISITDGEATIHENYILNVTGVNDAPSITGQSALSVNEDQSITILKSDLTIADPDNSSSDITITVQAGTNYTFSNNTVTPASNFSGQLYVNTVAHDLALNSQPYQVVVTVNPVNDPPAITGQSALSVNKNGSITIVKSNLTISDADNSSSDLTIEVQSGSNYTFSGNTVTPANNYTGQLSVNVIAKDLSSSSAAFPVVISVVTTGNEAPVITGQNALSINEDEVITILKTDLTITDPDDQASDISISVQDGTNYTHVGNVVTPAANYNGQLSVKVIANDLTNSSQVFNVLVTVNPVNDKPVISTSPSLSITAGTLYAYILTATDAENQTITKSSILIPAWLTFDPSTGILSGVPTNDNAGDNLVTLRVTDGIEDVDLSFTIVVSPSTAVDEADATVTGIYPSPASHVLNIRFNDLSEETFVEIISTSGAIVHKQIVPAHTDVATINVESIIPGMYMCHIKNSAFSKVQRFMIAR